MYSGDKVLYGVKSSIEELAQVLNLSHVICEVSCKHERVEIMEDELTDREFKVIGIHHASCCHFKEDGDIYIGIRLGDNAIVYRDDVSEFDTLDKYIEYFTKGLKTIQQNYKERQSCDIELKKLFPNIKPKVYSMSNDCGNCT